jgi:hypothetical protein
MRTWLTRANCRFALELIVNLVLPWATYTLLVPHTSEFTAIAWSAAPPALWSLLELALHRKLDALSVLVLAGIALSLVALAFGGSPRMLMVRENLFTIPIGLAFLFSLGLKKPLIYYAAAATMARSSPEQLAAFEAAWQRPIVTRSLRVISLVWGVGLVAQGLLLGWMAWTWPIPTFLWASPVIGYGILAILGLWTWYYRRGRQRWAATQGQ